MADVEHKGSARAPRVQFHLSGRSARLDPRTHAVRGDLADVSLASTVFAPHYARGLEMRVAAPSAFVREKGADDAAAASQLLHGESFHVLDITGKWAWGFCGHDGYVGYVEQTSLTSIQTGAPTHRIVGGEAPLFTAASIKSPVRAMLPSGALVSGAIEESFLMTEDGAVHLRHLAPLSERAPDWVEAARSFLGSPYVWGGRGAGGVDCSGLVQIALAACGISVPRDSDLQRESIGAPLAETATLRRGDFVFFPGHVGVMADETNLLHANAYWMRTVIEPLADVIARLATEHEQPVLAKRRIGA